MARTPKAAPTRSRENERRWTLLTPHALVLLCIARDPETRVREIAEAVGISERGAHQIVSDLVQAGYIRRSRVGRRNRYAIEEKMTLKHGILRHRRVASIVALLGPEPPRLSARASRNGRMASSVSKTPVKRRAA
jgi:DNA-binding IclR family transcriptional regulator